MIEVKIPESEMRGLRRSLNTLKGSAQRRVLSKALQAGAGVYKNAARAAAWPKRTGELKRSFIVRRFGHYGAGVGPRWKDITVGRSVLKSGRRGKLRKVTKANAAKTTGSITINPGRYAHLIEGGTKRGVTAHRILSTLSRSKKSQATAKVIAIAKREIAKEAAKAYRLSKGVT